MTGEMHEQTMAQEGAHERPHVQEAPRAFFRPKPDGNTDPAGEAGWYLERERERRGLSLQTVSRATGVHPQHLRAIELGMLENLPERAEALRMIGAYARFLGFDPQPLVAHYEAHLPPQQQQQQQQKAFSSARIISFPLLERLRGFSRTPAGMGTGVLTAMLLFGGLAWSIWPSASPETAMQMTASAQATNASASAQQADADKAMPPLPPAPQVAAAAASRQPRQETAGQDTSSKADPIAALIARTIPDAAQQADNATSSDKASAATASAPQLPPAPVAPPVSAEQASEQAAATPEQAQTAPTADNGPRLSPQTIRPLQSVPEQGIALFATEQIWLKLEDADGLPWFVGFLKKGEALPLPADKPLRLSASDVHRLQWYLNGQPMGRLGKRGAHLLSEPLDNLYRQSGLAVPKTEKPAG